MDEKLEIKHVPFLGTELVAARDADGQIWVDVRRMCEGLGLSEGQMKAERVRFQIDEVLSISGRSFDLTETGDGREVFCLKLNAVPIWLARVPITMSMIAECPEMASRLKQYQLHVRDVLAAAFKPESATHTTPAKATPSFGELAKFLKLMVQTMDANGQPPEVIAAEVKNICAQGGVVLSPDFIKAPVISNSDAGETLKPCPFCGGKAKLEDWGFTRQTGTTIRCSACGAYISESEITCDNWHQTVVEKWNHRPQDTKEGEREAMAREYERRAAKLRSGASPGEVVSRP